VKRVGIPRSKTLVLPNGVDLPAAASLPEQAQARATLGLPLEGLLVASVARLNPVKRLDVLLQALALVEEAKLVLVGDGPERGRLEALAESLGISGRVHLAGYREDVWPWLAACDVFALSSEWEGMPNAVLEAMAAGLPVVATRVGGTPDVVVEGVTGYLVPSDDPLALARALKALIRDSGLRYQMGAAGRHRVEERFSVERMVERTQALYEELLEGT
jgi:glycosyltransferase involved in cell wall biosynthesis